MFFVNDKDELLSARQLVNDTISYNILSLKDGIFTIWLLYNVLFYFVPVWHQLSNILKTWYSISGGLKYMYQLVLIKWDTLHSEKRVNLYKQF